MPYSDPVNFTATNRYGCGPDDEDDVYTVDEFRQQCADQAFVDSDGDGHPVRDGFADPSVHVRPSMLGQIPLDATHVVWFNK